LIMPRFPELQRKVVRELISRASCRHVPFAVSLWRARDSVVARYARSVQLERADRTGIRIVGQDAVGSCSMRAGSAM
jgi:hypothetical protein